MKKFLFLILFLSAFAAPAFAQITPQQPRFFGNRATTDQPATCNPNVGNWFYDTTLKQFKFCAATDTWSALGGGGGGGTGLLTLNGLTNDPQFFAIGTSGTNFNIVSSGSTHTFNFPNASAANRGLLLAADWTTFNNKVAPARQILTGSGLTGGGDLSADRTLSVDIPGLDAETTPGNDDLLMIYKDSFGLRRMSISDFIAGIVSGDALTSNPLSQFAATTSAELNGVISDETGTGSLVFGTSPILTTPTINVGSDATGDVYYRNGSGLFTRLPVGSNGNVLTLASGLPSWAAPSGGGGSPCGSDTQIQYNNSGSFGCSANFTYTSSTSQFKVISGSAADIPVLIQAAASQTGALTKWQNSSAGDLLQINSNGDIQQMVNGTFSLKNFSGSAFLTYSNTGIISIGAGGVGHTTNINPTLGGGSTPALSLTPSMNFASGGWNAFNINVTNSTTSGERNFARYQIGASTKYRVDYTGVVGFDRTLTAAATTGAQTINKPAFSVNFAAAATSLVVTNNLVDTTTAAMCQVMTNDATMFSVQAVAGSGTLTLHSNAAATAETKVYCEIRNGV